jgi:putative oxidoreductase
MTRWLNGLQPWGLLFIRLVLGVAMIYNGWPKVVPAGGLHGDHFAALDRFAHTVETLGLPRWLGYVSAFTELAGGICLVLGFLTRFCGFLVTINMLVAIGTVTIHKGYSGSAYPLALGSMAFLVLVAGPGKAALDRRFGMS